MPDADESDSVRIAAEAASAATRAQMMARASLIIACMAIAVAILGLFLPIS